ncbi:uncharacterized protein LOC123296209 [Chrysoperla carnea]|uniref:uncharacterized protein LOC123296209 n=1 Tax=Chrysoperla carnea TaxID=189513 RepID=UPI001D084E56|nr:uncharacterized protein LOC123296209 [Chrysoperla carnea]
MDEGVKYLSKSLKNSQITTLDLSHNHIGCNGVRYLTQVLRDTQISTLILTANSILDDGVKCLSDSLKDTKINQLNLSKNKTGYDTAQYLNEILIDIKIKSLDLDIHYTEDGDINKCISQRLNGDHIIITLYNNKISVIVAQYLNKILQNKTIAKLTIVSRTRNLEADDARYLVQTLKDTQITKLDMTRSKIGYDAALYLNEMLNDTTIVFFHIDIQYIEDGNVKKYISQRSYCDFKKINITLHNNKIGINGAQYLNKICQNKTIAELTLNDEDLEADDAHYLAQAFKDTVIREFKMYFWHINQFNGVRYLVQVFKDAQIGILNLREKYIGAKCAQCLAEFLREVKVIDLSLSGNSIGDEGMEYLVPVIKNSDIMYIDFSRNNITNQGAKYLSEILRNSKIITIDLRYNSIGPDGIRYLENVLSYSQVMHILILENLRENFNLRLNIITSENYRIRFKIIHNVFKKLVSLNTKSNEFEFTKNPTFNPDDYVFLFKALNENPNSKVHIFDGLVRKDYDMNTMSKINEFIAIMPKKFNAFLENKLLDFIGSFGNYNYVNLVKEFENMKLYDIVQNLLLHRVLYYVDENQEILHPYIYKTLNKYNMPLYNEQLEPSKKETIIAYYQNHHEIDGAQEIVDLLISEPFTTNKPTPNKLVKLTSNMEDKYHKFKNQELKCDNSQI